MRRFRFLIFVGSTYYADGGWGDFVGARDGLDEARVVAREAIAKLPSDATPWHQIVDTETLAIVEGRTAWE